MLVNFHCVVFISLICLGFVEAGGVVVFVLFCFFIQSTTDTVSRNPENHE